MNKLLLIFNLAYSVAAFSQPGNYREKYRPRFHFSPAVNWCNDPNGLVYRNGVYHLFYQHNPFGNKWGHMTWAHATSTDLVHWKHLPIAIPEENGTMIFSGTCVTDLHNSSGLGSSISPPMVAVYTGHRENINQSQQLAFSKDGGITWTKYDHNPVLDLHKKDFRDPKIFWYDQKKYWVMCVMLPVEHQVQFYSSGNLKDWKHLSDFGPAGDTSGVWECPDLSQVPVDGMPGKKKWLLQTSQNASMQYFVGEFDGENFVNESPSGQVSRPDYGPDYYAAITYNQLPATSNPIAIGWVNNWNYANDIPTTPWKGAMSLPRTLSVKKLANGWMLVQKPISALQSLRKKELILPGGELSGIKPLPVKGRQFEMECSFEPSGGSVCGLRIAVGPDRYFEIGIDEARRKAYIDREHSGGNGFNEQFKKLSHFEKEITGKSRTVRVHVFFDNSIAEVFINEGEAVFTAQLFPGVKDEGIEVFCTAGKCKYSNFRFWQMNSAW